MTEHSYSEKIKNKLDEHGRIYFNKLQRETGIPRATLTSKLNELKNAKQIDNEVVYKNGKVISEYFLTEDTKIRRLWQIDDHQKQDKKYKMKAYLLITYFAAFGYEYIHIKKPSEAGLGEALILTCNKLSQNEVKIDEYSLSGYKKIGVSIDDLVKLPGINHAAIFAYIDYSESELEKYFNILIKQNFPILTALQEHDKGDARYCIANKDLEVFIKKCWIMFYEVYSRMKDTWTYIRWPRPDLCEGSWFLMFFGEKRTENFISKVKQKRRELDKKNEQEKRDFTNYIYDQIKRKDINIIASARELLSDNDIRKKYSIIVNPLLEACYPNFIKTLHKKNEI